MCFFYYFSALFLNYIDMGSGIFYSGRKIAKKNVKKYRFLRTLFLAGALLFGMNNSASAATPSYVSASPQNFQVCQDATLVDIGSLLSINDADVGDIETWTLLSGPLQGSIGGNGTTMTSTGGVITPTGLGLTYTPNPGYNGNDIFTIVVDDGTTTDTMVVFVVVSELPSLTLGANPSVCAGATSATITYSNLTNGGVIPVVFAYTGFPQTWVVPAGITSIAFDVQGGMGGDDFHFGPASTPNPGNGGRAQGAIAVTPGQTLTMYVGGAGADGTTIGAAGGYNGGGNAFYYPGFGCGGAGGGASDIRFGAATLSDRIVVAGGGAGNGWDSPFGAYAGGHGGNLIGANGADNVGGSHASGGTQSNGGAPATRTGWPSGMPGGFGVGGDGSLLGGVSGGGGGGYYGGGGGVWTGGGGGSSYADLTIASLVSYTQGYNNGDGQIAIRYNQSGTYSIVWDAVAQGEGFVDVTNATLPYAPITFAVPAGAVPATYTGTLTISNGTCTSAGYPITVTVNPNPQAPVVANQTLCNGQSSTGVVFNMSGSPDTAYNWTNSNTSIGLAASGVDSIPSFVMTNATALTQVGTIIVTPVSSAGCSGPTATYDYTVYPTPTLSSGLNPADLCNGNTFNYTPASGTPGAIFTWNRPLIPGISNPATFGSAPISELLVNSTANPVTVTYNFTTIANGCFSNESVVFDVNPIPALSGTLTPGDICSGTLFSYAPASATIGTTFSWSRNPVAGITNPAASGTNDPNETLVNIASYPAAVTYTYSLLANGCLNTQNVVVNVNPIPQLSSTTAPAPVCSGTLFSYTPASATVGATFQWNRIVVPGISNSGAVGSGSVSETLYNTTPNPVAVTYEYDVIANGCVNNGIPVIVTVNPTPTLSSSLTPPATCSGATFSYTPTSATSGTTFFWTRDTVSGISNGVSLGTGDPMEVLVNTTSATVNTKYAFNLIANGCAHIDTVTVAVNAEPRLNSTLTPAAICDSTTFSYTPTSSATGATFSWTRAFTPGIINPAASGINNPNEFLVNTTNVSIPVAYNYVVNAYGCFSNPHAVTVIVHPTPKLSSHLLDTVCANVPFSYTPTSYTAGTTYDWIRPVVSNVFPTTNFGTASVNETLSSDIYAPRTVIYHYRLSANGCINTSVEDLKLTLNPAPPYGNITVTPPNVLCANTMYQTFGTDVPPPPGIEYSWSTSGNASVWAVGNDHQYALVNFYGPGVATVYVTPNVKLTGCKAKDSYTVNVTGSVVEMPKVIYYNGQFVCLKNDADTYQWGYDDINTLDSTILTEQTGQNYYNPSADLSGKRYWVIVMHNGCMQKAYFNAPVGVANVNNDAAELKVYPNPASEYVNVEINSSVSGEMQVEVINMLGQKLDLVPVVNHKAKISVNNLAAGCYLVDCYRDGVKIATSRFIKN